MDSASILHNAVLSTARRRLRAASPAASAVPTNVANPANGHAPTEDAQKQGYADGLQQGLADAAARIGDEIESRQRQLAAQFEQAEVKRADEHARRLAMLDKLTNTLSQAADAQLRAMEADAVALAFEALCRVLGPDSGREDLLARLVRQGLVQRRGHALLRLRMHPHDLADVQSGAWGLALAEQNAGMQWLADSSLARGSCLLETDQGTLDASLQTQLARLCELWTKAGGVE